MRGETMKRQSIYLAVLGLICLLALSGCARLELNYVIQDDGTVNASYVFAVDSKENDVADIEGLMDAAMTQASDNGFSLTSYEKDGYSGFKAEKNIQSMDLRSVNNELLGFDELPSIISEFNWLYSPGVFQNRYRMTLTMNLENIIDADMLNQLPSDLKERGLQAIEDSFVLVNFTLPGREEMSNADRTEYTAPKDSTRYTWEIKPGQEKTLRVTAILGKDKSRNRFVWGASSGFILLLIGICFLVSYRLKKKGSDIKKR
jgi:hypothetical protein